MEQTQNTRTSASKALYIIRGFHPQIQVRQCINLDNNSLSQAPAPLSGCQLVSHEPHVCMHAPIYNGRIDGLAFLPSMQDCHAIVREPEARDQKRPRYLHHGTTEAGG